MSNTQTPRLETAARHLAAAIIENVAPGDRVHRARLAEQIERAARLVFIRVYRDPAFSGYRHLTMHGKLLRDKRLEVSGGCCEGCGKPAGRGWDARVVVHHTTYDRLGEWPEELEDVRMVCLECHSAIHADRKRPGQGRLFEVDRAA